MRWMSNQIPWLSILEIILNSISKQRWHHINKILTKLQITPKHLSTSLRCFFSAFVAVLAGTSRCQLLYQHTFLICLLVCDSRFFKNRAYRFNGIMLMIVMAFLYLYVNGWTWSGITWCDIIFVIFPMLAEVFNDFVLGNNP